MQFIVTAYDGADVLEKRKANRGRHLENLSNINGKVICAGGIFDDDGRQEGSVLVMDFDSRSELDDYIANEPYVLENVWQKIEVEVINVVLAKGEPYKK